ncbi:MAG: trigger factor, partial [Betaproteobacteria bacterium]|nr:trigger factor [Betaproteobacteria bacterium]
TKTKDQVMEALAKVTTVELPRALVDMEISRLQESAVRDLEARGMTTKNMQLPPELFLERAEKRVKLGLILSEVIRKNDLKAGADQVRAVVEEHAESFENPGQMVRWYYSEPSRLAEVEAMVLEENVVEWAAKSMDTSDVEKPFDDIMEIKR